MSTFHAIHPGNASNPATWAENAVPGPTDQWIIEADVHLDSGLARQELDSGGGIEVQASTLTVDPDVIFTVNPGTSVTIDSGSNTLDLQGQLYVNGGTFSNLGQFESSNNSNAILAAWNGALLVNPTSFLYGRSMPQYLDDGSGNPTTVRLQYTGWNLPGGATYFASAQVLASVANGAALDFTTRDAAGNINDPDFLPTVPVVQQGVATDTIVTLRRNGTGSFTAAFPTPAGDQSYYVPVSWTIGGNTYVQEFRVTVQNPDLPGKVLGGGMSVIAGAGVQATLSADGLDAVSTASPTGPASTFREMQVQLWRRFFKKAAKATALVAGAPVTTLTTYADDGATPITTQTLSNAGGAQTQAACD
jgi:hypothetical protein